MNSAHNAILPILYISYTLIDNWHRPLSQYFCLLWNAMVMLDKLNNLITHSKASDKLKQSEYIANFHSLPWLRNIFIVVVDIFHRVFCRLLLSCTPYRMDNGWADAFVVFRTEGLEILVDVMFDRTPELFWITYAYSKTTGVGSPTKVGFSVIFFVN